MPPDFLVEDDLQQDRARQLVARLGVDHLEFDALEHHLLDVGQRDVAAVGRVVSRRFGYFLIVRTWSLMACSGEAESSIITC
jgi:hypothetical protein